jgi:DNA-binding protein HU-beta
MVLTAVKAIIEKMCDAEPVILNGLGTFDVRKRNERIIVNPGTGKKNLVPPKLVATFKPRKKEQLQIIYGNIKGYSKDCCVAARH